MVWWLWLVSLIAFLIAEALTVNLVTIWFALGSVVAMIASLSGLQVLEQWLLFTLVSCVGLVVFLLILKPRFDKKKNTETRTNADRIIGAEGVVTAVNPSDLKSGRILVLGQDWAAETQSVELSLAVGDRVIVERIQGVRAQVRKLDSFGNP